MIANLMQTVPTIPTISFNSSALSSCYLMNSSAASRGSSDDSIGEDGAFVNHAVPFPWKLHEMLEAAEMEGFTNIVSWLPDRSSFKVHKVEVFVRDIMPRFFRQTKYKSFQRQLNMWGFERLLSGPTKGGYNHTHFIRGQPASCRYMKRLKIKGTGTKRPMPTSSCVSSPLDNLTRPTGTPPRVISNDNTNNMLQSHGANTFAATKNDTFPRQHLVEQRLTAEPVENVTAPMITKSPSSIDLFDEDTLLSVLSSALEQNTTSNGGEYAAPNEGDCVLFEGMQFFFVEDYDASKSDVGQPQGKQSRRMSIEVAAQSGMGRRRLSLVGASSACTSLPSNFFSLEPCVHQPGHPQQQPQRANRRFSLQRGGTSNYVLKEIVQV